MKCIGGNIQNSDFKRDSGAVKGCNLCKAHLNGLNCVIL